MTEGIRVLDDDIHWKAAALLPEAIHLFFMLDTDADSMVCEYLNGGCFFPL
jgi:hypothetical protein